MNLLYKSPMIFHHNYIIYIYFLIYIYLLFFFKSNDPSAGSPTETLLRLLLPLNDKV